MNLIDFNINGRGFALDYKEKGTKNCKDDKYWLYFLNGDEKILMICLREDECILLSSLLSFGVHKKLVEIDKVGCDKK